MNPQLQKLMKELGDAINDSLSDSDEIAEVIAKIKAGGYDVFLVLEATIGFNRRDDDSPTKAVLASRSSDDAIRISPQDRKFLKSLRISIDEDDEQAA